MLGEYGGSTQQIVPSVYASAPESSIIRDHIWLRHFLCHSLSSLQGSGVKPTWTHAGSCCCCCGKAVCRLGMQSYA